MRTGVRGQILFWLTVLIAGLTIPALRQLDDGRVARETAAVRAAELQQQRNHRFASDALNAFFQPRMPIRAGPPPTLDDLAQSLKAIGASIDRTPYQNPTPEGQPIRPQPVFYSVTRGTPPARAWVQIDQRIPSFTGEQVMVPPTPVPHDFARAMNSIGWWCTLVWVITYFAWIRPSRDRQVQFAKFMIGVSLIPVLSTLGRWNAGSWQSLIGDDGPGIWLLLILPASVYILLHSLRMERRENFRFCSECRYDLFGNTSGKCPECGIDLTPAQRLYAFAMLEDWKQQHSHR